ncbi:MAG: ribonuclease R [Candidatus Paceibacteria bacterium]
MQNTYQGVLMVRGRGTGFIKLPDQEEDVIIETRALNTALDSDIVEVELLKKVPSKRQEGKVIRVIERSKTALIGVVKEKNIAGVATRYFVPDNRRIHVQPTLPQTPASEIGMKVVIEITHWPSPDSDPVATIKEVIGRAGDHETEMQAIIRGGGFTHSFPEDIQAEAQALHQNREQIFKDALTDPKRRDIREVTTFTIDPADAKDFDDALSLQTLPNGNIEIGVHIADVSHYVRPDTALDDEAKERATSVYLVDRVIPMLPEILSNDLCSLRPNEDRLAFSVIFEMSAEAEVLSTWYGQTVINSDRRFSYEDAQAVLDNGSGDFHTELTTMMTLGRKLRTKRFKEGAIAFEQPEVKFELDEKGVPIRAYKKERIETMLMIEDFMLLANTQVAQHIYDLAKSRGRDHAYIYRIHDVPNPDKIEELGIFLRALGHDFKTDGGIIKATDINKLLKDIEGTEEENLIKTATIRSMAKAIYSTKNIGHFGLAFKFYSHFTSPIRRYPDLLAHRLMRLHLDNTPIKSSEIAKFENISIQSTKREIEAVSAERDSIKFKQVEYMMKNVGKEFDGIITGVADWGVYVQEQDTLSEGMIKLSSIKSDYFEHEAKKYQIKGQRTGKIYRLGDTIRVKLVRADAEERQLDFELVV